MREIKFRAWDKEEHEMFSDVSIIDDTWDMLNEFLKHKDELVFMQYTGLTDKNGVEIYEGDILTSLEYPFQDDGGYNYHGVVEWADEAGAFAITKRVANSKIRGISDGIAEYMEDIELFEIIGNIYENPELLEESK